MCIYSNMYFLRLFKSIISLSNLSKNGFRSRFSEDKNKKNANKFLILFTHILLKIPLSLLLMVKLRLNIKQMGQRIWYIFILPWRPNSDRTFNKSYIWIFFLGLQTVWTFIPNFIWRGQKYQIQNGTWMYYQAKFCIIVLI